MYLVFGTKLKAQRLGYVADFCPICRSMRPMSVRGISTVGHIFFIESGYGGPVSWELTCASCGLRRPATHLLFTGFCREMPADLDELTERTNPRLREAFSDRFVAEEQLRTGRLDAPTRRALILEPFLACDTAAEWRSGLNWARLKHGLAFVGLGLAPLAFIGLLFTLGVQLQRTIVLGVGAALGATALGAILWVLADRRYYRNHRILPAVGMSLLPLRPNEAELTSALQDLRAMKLKLALRVGAQGIRKAIEAAELRCTGCSQ